MLQSMRSCHVGANEQTDNTHLQFSAGSCGVLRFPATICGFLQIWETPNSMPCGRRGRSWSTSETSTQTTRKDLEGRDLPMQFGNSLPYFLPITFSGVSKPSRFKPVHGDCDCNSTSIWSNSSQTPLPMKNGHFRLSLCGMPPFRPVEEVAAATFSGLRIATGTLSGLRLTLRYPLPLF